METATGAVQSPWPKIYRLARRRLGLVTRAELIHVGLSPRWIKRQAVIGRLEPLQRDVFLVDSFARTWHARALAGCLQCRRAGAVSHWTAAGLRGLRVPRDGKAVVDILTLGPASQRLRDGCRLHETSQLGSADRLEFEGLPMTTVARTLSDLAPLLTRSELEAAIDDALVRGLVTLPLLDSTISRLRRQGLAGPHRLEDVVAPWRLGRTESQAEAAALRLLLRAGLQRPVPQHVVKSGDLFVARVDFAWPEARLALEVDGFAAHDGPRKFVADRERWNRLRAAGWYVVPVTLAELRSSRSGALAVLRNRLAAARVCGNAEPPREQTPLSPGRGARSRGGSYSR